MTDLARIGAPGRIVSYMSPLEFDMADRMRKALRVSGVGVGDAAAALEVSRNTIGAWIGGKHQPRPRDLRAFAQVTGVPIEWLRSGDVDLAA